MLIGGLAILIYLLCLIITLFSDINLVWQAEFAYWALIFAFFVNSPHFMISYLIFYKENYNKLLNFGAFSIVGLYIPVFLIAIIILGLFTLNSAFFKYLLLTMFFLVGWHYIKQAYGCFIVYSAGNKNYYNKSEQNIIKFSLYPLWIFSFFNIFTHTSTQDYWGFRYEFPPVLLDFKFYMGWLSIIGLALLISMFAHRVFIKNKTVNIVALTSLVVIFVWLSPLLYNPYYFLIIPFFHSLQYFLFSGAYTKNKIIKKENKRLEFFKWWGIAFILGALMFDFVPKFLDSVILVENGITPNLFLLSFILFINIHHYFIDSVIWKGTNKDVRNNLIFKLTEK